MMNFQENQDYIQKVTLKMQTKIHNKSTGPRAEK